MKHKSLRDFVDSGLWILVAAVCYGVKGAVLLTIDVIEWSLPVVKTVKSFGRRTYELISAKHVLLS